MGTPDFAVPSLEALLDAGHEVVLVVTQPDKPKGRGGKMQFPPVKECSMAHDIPVFQPRKIREKEAVENLRAYRPDFIVVAAFGQILPKEILDMPRFCCINVHASLLPKYRGAAPIQWALLNGEKEAGVTIMRMDVGLDTGDMIEKVSLPIDKEETGGSLFEKLSVAGAKLLAETIEKIAAGTATYTPQDEAQATHTTMIQKSMGSIDWEKSAVETERLVRAMNPWPSAYTALHGKTLKVWTAAALPENTGTVPGTVTKTDGNGMYVQTGDGTLLLKEIQLEGKKRMSCDAFLRGYPIEQGTMLL
jgi:methionyl-tRNA formyltransferase